MARAVTSVGDRIAAFASAGTLYLVSYQNETFTRSGCGWISVDLADVHTQDSNVVPDVDAIAVLEVRNDIRAVDGVAGPEQRGHTGDQQHDKGRGDPASAKATHCPASPGAGGGATSPGAGIMTGLGVGSGVDSSPGGATAGGPGGGPPGGGAGSGSRYG